MDPFAHFFDRLALARVPLYGLFAAGFAVALWDPRTKLILTLALGLSCGMVLLGPYSAAALYATRLQTPLGGHLRWPLCLLLSTSAVLLLDALLGWTTWQLVLAGGIASVGTILGHDATIAILELRSLPGGRVDPWMVVLFPVFIALAVVAGYCSLGFGLGLYHFVAAIL